MRLMEYIEVADYKNEDYVKGCCIERKRVPVTWESQVNDALEELQEYGAKIISVGRPYAKDYGAIIPVEYEGERSIEHKMYRAKKTREKEKRNELLRLAEKNRENAPSIREIIDELAKTGGKEKQNNKEEK